MQKLLLVSILAATVAIPLIAARARSLRQSVRRSVVLTATFCFLYWLGLLYVYPTKYGAAQNMGRAVSP